MVCRATVRLFRAKGFMGSSWCRVCGELSFRSNVGLGPRATIVVEAVPRAYFELLMTKDSVFRRHSRPFAVLLICRP